MQLGGEILSILSRKTIHRQSDGKLTLETVKQAHIIFPCGCQSDKGLYIPCRKHKHLLLTAWEQRIKHLPEPKVVRFLY